MSGTQANVVLRFFTSGQNSVSGIMDKLSGKKKDLAKPVTIPIDADGKPATITMDKVKAEADNLNKKRAEFKIGANDAEGKAKLLAIDLRLEKLNKYMARPGVELQGKDKTLLGIYRISAALDKLNGKLRPRSRLKLRLVPTRTSFPEPFQAEVAHFLDPSQVLAVSVRVPVLALLRL